ncbi:hypothetical protein GCM10007148_28690 [Parvularcula lutaonensis]|nr:hypothetical protein GCM10007148_28690 [Parvularcula lutaonensis]
MAAAAYHQYENEIVEIEFDSFFTIVISQEKKLGEYHVSAISMREEQVDKYNRGRNDTSEAVPLDEFMRAINEAVNRLKD